MYVALGLSAGSTALFHGGTAYAAETHDYTETAASVSGLEGTDKTGFMSDNNIVLGTEGGPTNRPFNTFGIFSGGGKKNATADVSNNTITIHGLRANNGGGYSMVYGGISGTGAVTGNKVIFNHGETADALVGGYTNATDKDVRGNSVTVADGTIKDDIIGGWAGRASSTGTLEGNTVTITTITFPLRMRLHARRSTARQQTNRIVRRLCAATASRSRAVRSTAPWREAAPWARVT